VIFEEAMPHRALFDFEPRLDHNSDASAICGNITAIPLATSYWLAFDPKCLKVLKYHCAKCLGQIAIGGGHREDRASIGGSAQGQDQAAHSIRRYGTG
jgi:hypothetical protein